MVITITRGTIHDYDIIPILFDQAGEDSIEVNKQFFLNENNIMLIAWKECVPCGFLYGYLLESVHRRMPQLFLYSIDVFAEHQNKGVGSRLVESFINLAKEKNCSEVFVITNDHNVIAKKLYEGTGGQRDMLDEIMYIYPLV
ncbi:GNAT family N-acetyltransferase [Bacillus tamaricis]|uniref:GNAT family N-acetyltransferase n=2 Tax=Evansella tamaricis TaxID=2069301 RepID=A0ABS6JBC3_9BACI|nr:GNAT family N-acetyltransferase [Evansella tamaricis]MBU9710846.1 GNAT family N-acetyltransferase [Evansella tamaricis]